MDSNSEKLPFFLIPSTFLHPAHLPTNPLTYGRHTMRQTTKKKHAFVSTPNKKKAEEDTHQQHSCTQDKINKFESSHKSIDIHFSDEGHLSQFIFVSICLVKSIDTS